MRKIICLSTAEIVDITMPIPWKPKVTLEDLVDKYVCYRSIYGLHFYLHAKGAKALFYIGNSEVIPNYLLEIVEV